MLIWTAVMRLKRWPTATPFPHLRSEGPTHTDQPYSRSRMSHFNLLSYPLTSLPHIIHINMYSYYCRLHIATWSPFDQHLVDLPGWRSLRRLHQLLAHIVILCWSLQHRICINANFAKLQLKKRKNSTAVDYKQLLRTLSLNLWRWNARSTLYCMLMGSSLGG